MQIGNFTSKYSMTCSLFNAKVQPIYPDHKDIVNYNDNVAGHGKNPHEIPRRKLHPDISALVFSPVWSGFKHCGAPLWECSDSRGAVAHCTLHDTAVGETRRGWHISDVY